MKDKAKDFTVFLIAIIIFYSFIFLLGYTCPIKALTGVSSMGCGMTRAWMSLLRLRPDLAFSYHPLFPLPAIFLIGYLFRNRLPDKVKKMGLVAIFILFLCVYIRRMMDSNDNIVVFRPKESIVYQAYQGLRQ